MSLTNRQARGAGRNNRRGRLTGAVLGMALVTASLGGCAATPDLDRNAARQLQSRVLAVTGAAAANDPAASLKHLDALVLDLDEAAARGDVSFKRHQSISKSVDAVRADLKARQAEAKPLGSPPSRRPRPLQTRRRQIAHRKAAAEKAAAQAAAAQAAAAAAAAAPPPAVAPAPADKGKSKGKGKGKTTTEAALAPAAYRSREACSRTAGRRPTCVRTGSRLTERRGREEPAGSSLLRLRPAGSPGVVRSYAPVAGNRSQARCAASNSLTCVTTSSAPSPRAMPGAS